MGAQLVTEPEQTTKATISNPLLAAPVATISVDVPPTQSARPLFSQSFVEESGTDLTRKHWTQASSFFVQTVILGVLILLPLWFTDVLPVQQLATFLVAPPPPPPPPPPAAPTIKVARVSEVVNGQLRAPSRIPEKVKMIREEETPPSVAGVIGGVEGGVPGGQVNGVLGALLPTPGSNPAALAGPQPKRLRVSSGISEGLLFRRVEPVYPVIASRARIEGTVQLRAVISKEGAIENLQIVSGHPLLVGAAMEAVKQWRYHPYILNGDPLEVETMVIVNFHMN
jgi:periplasmic protein TonB